MGHSRVPDFCMMLVVAMIVPTGYLAYEHYHSTTAGVLAAVAMPVVAIAAGSVVLIACIATMVPPVVVFFWCLNHLGFWPKDLAANGLSNVEEQATGSEGLTRLARVMVGVYAVTLTLLGYLAYMGDYEVAAQIFRVVVTIAGSLVGACAGLVGMVSTVEYVIARRERMRSGSPA